MGDLLGVGRYLVISSNLNETLQAGIDLLAFRAVRHDFAVR